MKKIVIFASGSGSNAENIYNYFHKDNKIKVTSFFTNNPNAGVINRAKKLGVPCVVFDRSEFTSSDIVLNKLIDINPHLVVLAGFLWLVPEKIIDRFEGKIINIHPALLPKFGGKGMYGDKVHEAVIDSGEKESGITIHWVNKHYDEGKTILQERIKIETGDTPESLAENIHEK